MDLLYNFKRHYFNYLLSTITPVIITAFSIPLFKHILGAEGYGRFSITFNSVLLCTAILSGWVWQSILRYFPASNHKHSFISTSLLISCLTQAIFLLPVLAAVWYIYNDFLLAVFFSVTLIISSLQFSLLAISQSVFLSKKSIYYELIRNVSYLTSVLVLLKCTSMYYMYALFSATIISYLLSFLYLYVQTNKQLFANHSDANGKENVKTICKLFLLYGWPLSLWFVIALLMSLTDKYFILKTAGAEVQGNYQALFDFLSKSIIVLLTPVNVSLFPLLTSAYQKGEKEDIKRLLLKIIGFETVALILAVIVYWWFGADILFTIIKTPATLQYKIMGLIIIAGTFIWQIAMVAHKRHELKYRSGYMLGMISIAFLFQLLLYLIFSKNTSQLIYPLGYLLSSFIYLFLVSIGQVKSYFRR